jgi:hypothetical protein
MPTIDSKTLTKEKEQVNKERLKGKGLEQPCYIEPPPPKKSKK